VLYSLRTLLARFRLVYREPSYSSQNLFLHAQMYSVKVLLLEPLDGISESTVTVRYGDRLRVVAIRFEGLDQRWLCTALNLI